MISIGWRGSLNKCHLGTTQVFNGGDPASAVGMFNDDS